MTSVPLVINPFTTLTEHLDYFEHSVAGNIMDPLNDFDDVFSRDLDVTFLAMMDVETEAALATHKSTTTQFASIAAKPSPPASPALKSTPYLAIQQSPPSPTSVAFATEVLREHHTSSPTTVSSDFFAAQPAQPISSTATTKAKTAPRKKNAVSRKRSISQTDSESGIDQEEVRRERNRHHAKRSRQRKRDVTQILEQSVQEIKKENEYLRALLGGESNEAERKAADERRKMEGSEKFIQALMDKPEGRVLNETSLSLLRQLFST